MHPNIYLSSAFPVLGYNMMKDAQRRQRTYQCHVDFDLITQAWKDTRKIFGACIFISIPNLIPCKFISCRQSESMSVLLWFPQFTYPQWPSHWPRWPPTAPVLADLYSITKRSAMDSVHSFNKTFTGFFFDIFLLDPWRLKDFQQRLHMHSEGQFDDNLWASVVHDLYNDKCLAAISTTRAS